MTILVDNKVSIVPSYAPLKFSNTFSTNSNDEIDLVWMEIASNGDITYVV